MIKKRKPMLGLLGIMHGLYDEDQPELPREQEEWIASVMNCLADICEIDFPGAAKDRAAIERTVSLFNEKKYDGIIVVNLLYSPGMRVVQAFKDNNLPVLIANIQPLPSVTTDWDWKRCTTNQGIHGIQDTANMILRVGGDPVIVTEDWESDGFHDAVADWAIAAMTVKELKKLRACVMCKMQGMGDILGDEVAYYRMLGIEVFHEGMGGVVRCMEKVSESEVDEYIALDRQNFDVSAQLPEASHRYAAKLQLAYEKFLDQNGYNAFTANFNAFKDDGRISQLPILGASNMLAKGYGYAAEGDVHIMAVTMMGHLIDKNPHFTEMYSLDFKRDATFLSHMGEGNWKVARKDRRIKLIDRPLDIGDRDNPPTPIYSAEPGLGTIVSLVPVEGNHFRLVVSPGTILDTEELPNMRMNYTFFRPNTGVKSAMNNWLRYGGTHHQVLFMGDVTNKFKMLCHITGIEYVEV